MKMSLDKQEAKIPPHTQGEQGDNGELYSFLQAVFSEMGCLCWLKSLVWEREKTTPHISITIL
jgi:hypothetical protein